MLDMGANVTTSQNSQNSSIQSNTFTINVGDGGQDSYADTSQTPTQLSTQEQTQKDDTAASVGLGFGGSGSGGAVSTSEDIPQDTTLTDYFSSTTWKQLMPYAIVGIISTAFVFFLVSITGGKKKKAA